MLERWTTNIKRKTFKHMLKQWVKIDLYSRCVYIYMYVCVYIYMYVYIYTVYISTILAHQSISTKHQHRSGAWAQNLRWLHREILRRDQPMLLSTQPQDVSSAEERRRYKRHKKRLDNGSFMGVSASYGDLYVEYGWIFHGFLADFITDPLDPCGNLSQFANWYR